MNKLNNVDLEEIKIKLYEKLKPSGWGDKLKTFIMSEDFDRILKFLLSEAQQGKRFTPVMKQLFRAFEECPYKDLMVVTISQDPYPQMRDGVPVSDGIPFSCSNTGVVEASLRYMFKEVEETVYKDGYTWDPNLARWSNQGVLMLNCALTTTLGKTGQHYKIWEPFMTFIFDMLTRNNPNLVYVFLGKKAAEWSDSIPDNNHKIFASHPASAAYADAERWNSDDAFNKVNEYLQKAYNCKIVW